MTFQDKVALITGGGTGIGRSAAESLVALGAKVVINGRRKDILTEAQSQIDASGKKVTTVAGDIANPVTAQRMIEAALKHFGGVDILINNAGIFKPAPFLEHTADEVNAYLDIILKAHSLPRKPQYPKCDNAEVGRSSTSARCGQPRRSA
jgi:NAD(P)-dependent dehydrogenase (short-subunit alcohol dehydrogenase family)